MTLKEQLEELEARRVAITAMLQRPELSQSQRADWRAQLDAVLKAKLLMDTDLKDDPAGYLCWFLAENERAFGGAVPRAMLPQGRLPQ